MNKQPSVSIIIPYKDNIKYLFSALNSTLKQTYKNFEVIIIYDDENKADLKNIRKYLKMNHTKKLPKVSIEINNRNLGAGHSRNKGIRKSKTKYVAFLDSDDLWAKNKLKTQIEYMEKYQCVFSHTSYYVINEENNVVSVRNAKKTLSFNELVKSCDIGLSTVVINRNFIKKNNFYFPKIKTKEDFVLWLKIIKEVRFIRGINKKLTYYRKTNNSLSSDKLLSLINGYKVYRFYMKYSIIRSIYYLLILSINFVRKNVFRRNN